MEEWRDHTRLFEVKAEALEAENLELLGQLQAIKLRQLEDEKERLQAVNESVFALES